MSGVLEREAGPRDGRLAGIGQGNGPRARAARRERRVHLQRSAESAEAVRAEAESLGGKVLAFQSDVTDFEAAGRARRGVKEACGRYRHPRQQRRRHSRQADPSR